MASPFLLLAEDSPADVFIVRRSLRKHLGEFDLQVVEDGEKALRFIEQIEGEVSARVPELVMIDLNLPRKSGEEILKCIRGSAKCANIPVIVLTASDSPVDRTATLKHGATAWFHKPLDLERFMEIGRLVKDSLATQSESKGGSNESGTAG